MRECRLWSTRPCWVLYSSSSIRTGCPYHAIHRHIATSRSVVEPGLLTGRRLLGERAVEGVEPGDGAIQVVEEEARQVQGEAVAHDHAHDREVLAVGRHRVGGHLPAALAQGAREVVQVPLRDAG